MFKRKENHLAWLDIAPFDETFLGSFESFRGGAGLLLSDLKALSNE